MEEERKKVGRGKENSTELQKPNVKGCLNYHTIVLISQASKGLLKILQARLQQYMNQELPDI